MADVPDVPESPDVSAAILDDHASWHRLRFPTFKTFLLIALVIVGILWAAPLLISFFATIDLSDMEHLYGFIFLMVVFDAVVPIFPSESLLTTASNLAAQDGSSIELWRLMLVGSLGAIVGDSLLYWLSRTVLRRYMAERVDQLQQNEKVARSMAVMSTTAPTLILFGRFVPGLRFLVGATMGLTKFPYRRFLLWDSLGGTAWAVYTCFFSYLVASVIDDRPLLSIAVSVIVTTALLGLLYKPLKNSWERNAPTPATPSATPDADRVDPPA